MTGKTRPLAASDLLQALTPIPVGGHGRLAWLARLDAIVAEDVTKVGEALVEEEGWDRAAAHDAMVSFGDYLAGRIVAVAAAAADTWLAARP